MNQLSPHWKQIFNFSQLDQVIESSKHKPSIVFIHGSTIPESIEKKIELENNWLIEESLLDTYIVDPTISRDIAQEIANLSGISLEVPQVVLFADGVTMYDESRDLISAKKIKLALKIVNRTFKWIETRA